MRTTGVKSFCKTSQYLLKCLPQFHLTVVIVVVLTTIVKSSHSYLRYTEQSCSDLVPKNIDQYRDNEVSQFLGFDSSSSNSNRNRYRGSSRRKRSGDQYGDEPPYTLVITGRRYRRNSDLNVKVTGPEFDGIMIQSRVVSGGELLRGGVGLLGQFRYLSYLYEYSPCFGLPFATVVDKGRPVKLGNASFIWSAPDIEAGDIRFIASVLRGIHYWIIVSNVLSFNPFPISTYACGSSMACFRVCSKYGYPCTSRDSLYILTYSMDSRDRRDVTFTMGGRLHNNQTYLAVAFGDDFDKLVQADLTVCYLEKGRAKIEHLLIESLLIPPYQHNEIIELDDYDFDGRMLWCRFRRPLTSTTINPRVPLYHFYFWGTMDIYYNRFILPPRHRIYNSAFKRNFSMPFNELVSSSFANTPFSVLVFALYACLAIVTFT